MFYSCITLQHCSAYACMSTLSPTSKQTYLASQMLCRQEKKRLATYHIPNDKIVRTLYNEAKASDYRLRTSRGINNGAQIDWLQCVGNEIRKNSIRELKPGLQYQTQQSNSPPSCSSHFHYPNVSSTSWFRDAHHDSPTEDRCRHQNRETTQAGTTTYAQHQSNR
mmetsp:Transcript_11556/g.20876  ORF Transcript_11556/g.20876 Transcript_11556/m.20876 type:complete len:165 (+) Transcript_11556:308-802(+)